MSLWACWSCNTVKQSVAKPRECDACGYRRDDVPKSGPSVFREVGDDAT